MTILIKIGDLRMKHPRIWVPPTKFQKLSKNFKIEFLSRFGNIFVRNAICFISQFYLLSQNFWYLFAYCNLLFEIFFRWRAENKCVQIFAGSFYLIIRTIIEIEFCFCCGQFWTDWIWAIFWNRCWYWAIIWVPVCIRIRNSDMSHTVWVKPFD